MFTRTNILGIELKIVIFKIISFLLKYTLMVVMMVTSFSCRWENKIQNLGDQNILKIVYDYRYYGKLETFKLFQDYLFDGVSKNSSTPSTPPGQLNFLLSSKDSNNNSVIIMNHFFDKLHNSINLLNHNNDEFLWILNINLNYELDKKKKLLHSVNNNNFKMFSNISEIILDDYINLVEVILNPQIALKPYQNLSLFFKFGLENEINVTFGGFFEEMRKKKLFYSRESFQKESELLRKNYNENVKKIWVNKNHLISEIQQEIQSLNSLKDWLNLSDDIEVQYPHINNPNFKLSILTTVSLFASTKLSEIWSQGENPQLNTNELNEMNSYNCPLKDQKSFNFDVQVNPKITNLSSQFAKTLSETLDGVNVIAQKEDFLDEIAIKKYVGFTPNKVIEYLKGAHYNVNFSGRWMFGRVFASAGLCSDYVIFNSRLQYRKGASLAATIFHEITHNLGFGHDTMVPYPLGDLMQKYYEKYMIQNEEDGDVPKVFPFNYTLEGFYPEIE
jgi:hypothetical protein